MGWLALTGLVLAAIALHRANKEAKIVNRELERSVEHANRLALEAEIARLQGENIAIKKELLARNLPLPGTVKPEPPAARPRLSSSRTAMRNI